MRRFSYTYRPPTTPFLDPDNRNVERHVSEDELSVVLLEASAERPRWQVVRQAWTRPNHAFVKKLFSTGPVLDFHLARNCRTLPSSFCSRALPTRCLALNRVKGSAMKYLLCLARFVRRLIGIKVLGSHDLFKVLRWKGIFKLKR